MSEKRYENKYAKIQPAVAIKPKPIKGQSPSKVSFDPKYDPLKSVTTILTDDKSNINTSRQWVLPPKPRPGRKPIVKDSAISMQRSGGSGSGVMSSVPGSGPGSAPGSVSGSNLGTSMAASKLTTSVISGTSAGSGSIGGTGVSGFKSRIDQTPISNTYPEDTQPGTPVQQEVTRLQKTLLARLKEQELVQNYIEVLTNHIHELKLAQSGVITFDALNQELVPMREVHTSPDHLDHIHNVRDLDKFLAHLTTQSKVIHSVTKKYVNESGDGNLQQQIKHQLRLKKKYETAHKPQSRPIHRTTVLTPQSTSSEAETAKISAPKTFTPSLLRPMNLNAFDQEDDVIDVDIIKDSDMFTREDERFKEDERSRLDFDRPKDEDAFAAFSKSRRRGCGFCSGDGPCLCFDADSLFGEGQ